MIPRRQFLRIATALPLLGAAKLSAAPGELRGIFPIVATPYLPSGGVDLKTLASELKFLDRCQVHGVVWPQLASEYSLLTFDERIAGMDAISAGSKGLSPAVVLGVQAEDTATAVKYAAHAEQLAPSAIIAIPPRKDGKVVGSRDDHFAYYRAIGDACSRPLFIQAIGDMPLDFILEMAAAIPTLRYVKDEAGHTLSRISEFRASPAKSVPAIFTGGHGQTLPFEMARGSAGCMPAAPFADLYVDVWKLEEAGLRAEALEAFSRITLLLSLVRAWGLAALAYILQLRGVFPNGQVRNPDARPLDDAARASIARTLDHLRPYLRA